MWRGDVRLSMSVSAPFVWRCLSGSAVAPFPHPAHRTGRADLSGSSAIAGFRPHRSHRAALPQWALQKGPEAAGTAFPDNVVGSACTSSFSRLAQRSLALRPAHSRGHLYVTSYTEGFSHFVTSLTAPVASGWSGRRVGPAPTGKRRLVTAHTLSGHCEARCRRSQFG